MFFVNKELDLTSIIETVVGGLAVVFIVFVATLLYKKRKKFLTLIQRFFLKLLPANFNIAFSIEFKEGLNSGIYYEQILSSFRENIKTSGLEKQIQIKDFSNLKVFVDKEEAEKFRNEKSIDLIIWGTINNDNLKVEGAFVNKINMNFTFGYPGKQGDNIGKLLLLDIKSRFAQNTYWQIIENNSSNDIQIATDDIFNISTYILALSLKLFGKITRSIYLFENLYDSLTKRNSHISEKLIPHLIDCYEIVALEKGLNEKDYSTAIKYCHKILHFRPESFFPIANLAVFYYRDGNLSESNKFVNILKKKHPRNTITLIDLAFIKILGQDFDTAYSLYSSLSSKKEIHFNPQEVVEFLALEYEIIKEPALFYGSGIISYYFGDRVVGINDLKTFIKKAKTTNYNLMIKEAKRLTKPDRRKRKSLRN